MAETIAYFDCSCGAGGDMILAGLIDAGAPLDGISEQLAKLSCGEDIRLCAEAVKRCGIRALKVEVKAAEKEHAHRGLGTIREMIESSALAARVKERAVCVFTHLAEAEATVHGVSVEEVHFHEVGALDAIADIVGIACALELLGVERLFFSTLSLGGGTVECAHGTLPVPAPAAAELVRGFRCEMGPVERELLTPTAAAVLTALGTQDQPPAFTVTHTGYGAGTLHVAGQANVVQVVAGQVDEAGEGDSVWVVEANVDDTTPEVCGYAIERLLDAGALDAYTVPLVMKQSRPGFMLCAVVADGALAAVEEVFFRETTTLGVRRTRMARTCLKRDVVRVDTEYGSVQVKVGFHHGQRVTISPEFADCRALALKHNVPLREVMARASEAGTNSE